MKVGVLVVAYNAESTLARVLDRIPDATQLRLAEVLAWLPAASLALSSTSSVLSESATRSAVSMLML